MLDENGEPRIRYQLSEADKRRFREGVAQAVRMMFLAGATEVYLPTMEDILGSRQPAQLRPVVLTTFRQADQVGKNLRFI